MFETAVELILVSLVSCSEKHSNRVMYGMVCSYNPNNTLGLHTGGIEAMQEQYIISKESQSGDLVTPRVCDRRIDKQDACWYTQFEQSLESKDNIVSLLEVAQWVI